ncbi:mannosyl-3-phosphoglycerate phosphatase [Pyrococcus yayanosii]|uniref:Mannosyl-3-phosphoglycerate phosphatase n=1 Tax=Pyrococcus yayanosii (strain CH1 / JCM 16557) TaxID=529709 RepID=F8AIL7_PYRYC|nr:mannosyl-3-phosphoglycerate phosphatase [Pyrococcus yayanosii]AEH24384.1 mannosyl-3-phosphoglycerate phosphatase [Pyrococcus yayanosii CH1]
MRAIFLDLDKTLIGDDYSPELARPVVKALKRKGFIIVFNTSKTRAEVEYYRQALGVEDPFIVENGSAIFIPKDYFPFPVEGREKGEYIVIELGMRYETIREALDEIAQEYGLKYYGNSTIEEVVAFTGLPRDLAKLAVKREYSETVFRWTRDGWAELLKARGLKVTRGSRFHTVTGNTDKGSAARVLLDLYLKVGPVESWAVGDGENDLPMFDVVDRAFIVGDLRHSKAKNIPSIEKLLEVIG